MSISAADRDDRSRLFWKMQALGWGGALLVTLGIVGQVYSPVLVGMLVSVCRNVFGFTVTSMVLRPVLRAIRKRGKICTVPHFAVILLACALLGLADTLFITWLAEILHVSLDQPGIRLYLAASVLIRGVLYLFWSILYFAVHYRIDTQYELLRTARAEAATRASELQMLRAQVNPHFLFNSLNSILAASADSAAVRRITLALAEYLRFSLVQHGEKEALGVELGALENYLRVEKIRFERDLEYRIDTDASASETLAPVALVQPLLENAIKYGQRSTIRPLRIAITAAVEGNTLVVTVTNSGEWIVESSSTKTGLVNLRRRLELLYPGEAVLTTEGGNGEVRAQVRLPAERKEKGSQT